MATKEIFRGVDLGAHHSVCASSFVDAPEVLAVDVNDLANRSTPSVVCIEERTRTIGEAAEGRVSGNPAQTYTYLLPALFEGLEAKARYEWFWDSGKPLFFNDADWDQYSLSEQQLLGIFLKKLVTLKHHKDVDKHRKVCVAVPDFVAEDRLAGLAQALKVANLIDITDAKEGEASTSNFEVAYHSECLATQWTHKYFDKLTKDNEAGTKKVVLIVDMGYSQTTVSSLQLEVVAGSEEGKNDITGTFLAKESVKVGVYDFIVNLCKSGIDYAKSKYKQDVNLGSKKGYKLKVAMTRALKELSMLPDASVALECWLDDDVDFLMDLKRADLEAASEPLLVQIEQILSSVVAKTAETAAIDNYEIVGGGVRIPCVQARITKACNISEEESAAGKLGKGLDGSSAVATGACLRSTGRRFIASKLEGFDIVAAANAVDPKCIKFEEEMQAIESKETERLEMVNKFEAYIFAAKKLVTDSSSKSGFEGADDISKTIDDEEMWLYDHMDDRSVSTEDYASRREKLELLMKEKGKKYYEAQAEKEAKLNAELEAAYAEKQKEEKEDHDTRNLPKSERMRLAEKQRLEGNELFKAQSYQDAILRYQKAQSHLSKLFDCSPDETAEKNKIELSCHLNTAQCYLKGMDTVGDNKDKQEALYKKIDAACDKALEIDEKNVKALFRKATAQEKFGEVDKAMKLVKKGLEVEPESKEFKQMEARLERQKAINKKKEQKMYGKMFG